ncbi:MAG: glycosyltransferase family 4 protein [Solirubrobacteraceae bacterium]
MRICLIYDCLFPHTVGGAERWYRNLAERLGAAGHEVTYLTLTQWAPGEEPALSGVRVVAVGPRMELYADGGRRRIAPPLRFGGGVLGHLLRHGRDYDVVHTASFPYFSLLAAGLVRRRGRYRLVVDWHEVWSRDYWREYLGPGGGAVGYAVQRVCARIGQEAFCFSRLHAARLRAEGLRGEVTVLAGEYTGTLEPPAVVVHPEPVAVFAGRLIPEKRAPLAVAAMAAAARTVPGLRGVIYGDGPTRDEVARAAAATGGLVTTAGFVDSSVIDEALRGGLCMVLTSRREGYGMVVVEAAARGTPSIVVAGEDNAATELIEDGVNGFVVAEATAAAVAAAIVGVHAAGPALRASTAAWFAENATRLSLASSLERVLEAYASTRA